MKRTPYFQQVSGEIETAIDEVLARHAPAIKRRKRSANLLGYWIMEGAHRACRHLGKPRR